MRRNVILLFLGLISILLVNAEQGKLFSADKELSNSLINDIMQDRNEVIWIATEDGLNRYDGSKFIIYRHDISNPKSIKNNYVRMLFEDRKGRFFIGLLNGLQLYDHATDTFEEIPLIKRTGTPLKTHAYCMIQRKNGDILIGTTGEGVFKLSEDDKLIAKYYTGFGMSDFVNFLYEDTQGNLWIATQDKGLFRIGSDNQLTSFFKRCDIGLNNVSNICEDHEGNLLVGTLTRGLFLYNKKTDSFDLITYKGRQTLPIKTLYKDESDDVFIGTDGLGVKIYKTNERKIIDTLLNVASFSLDKSKVHSILKDKSGNTWMGIFQKGAILIPTQTNKFNYIGYKSVLNNTIGTNCVMSVCEDESNILWVGVDNDGIYGVRLNGRQCAHFEHSENPKTVPSTIMSIFEDSNKDLWLGSYLNGMGKLNRLAGEYERVEELVDDNGSPVEKVYCFAEDSENHLWIGTMGAGLYRMDLKTHKITNYNKTASFDYKGEGSTLDNYYINSLLYSSDNKLYIGTYDGLLCLDLKTDSYISTFGVTQLLRSNVIFGLYEDQQGNIWLGTSEGLRMVDNETHQITTYTIENGLPSNVICAIQGDSLDNLWVSTHYGISRYDKTSNSFVNYYASDGLQGNEFSKNVSFTNKNGTIIFGGINGITYFDPKEINFSKKELNIRISDFYIHNQPLRKGMKSGSKTVINTALSDAKEFRLSHKDNSFSIEFSVMEFNAPERIIYSYKLNDDNWVTLLPGTNRVTFSNLTPDKYNFIIKAKDYNSYSKEKRIAVIISPAWYFSPIAKIVYFCLGIFLIYFVVNYFRQRYRSRQKMLEHKHAQDINEAKLQFFMNIAHEIRTPMTLILSPLKKLMLNDTDKERGKNYAIINRNAERILNLINQLMDIRKIDKGLMDLKFQEVEIVAFLKELCEFFEYQGRIKQINFTFHSDVDQIYIWIDPKNFDKIILNVLSNAFKYTPQDGNITLLLGTCQIENKEFCEIIISDDGIGIPDDELERIFERFYQIRNSYNSSNVSTGIGLHLTRSLVELHHGTINAERNEGSGTRFIIRIPLGADHLRVEEIENNPDLKQLPIRDIEPIESEQQEEEVKIRAKSKYRVIVVDDEEEIRKYVCRELSSEYHMLESSNGAEALAMILKTKPDLVISDVMMPEMDGITLCRKIKQNVNINHIPIILLTAKAKEEDSLEGLSTGADAYIVKPFNVERLKKTVENIIRNRELLRNTYKGNQHQESLTKKIELKSADEKLMEKVMKVINTNIANPRLSVEMISNEVGISRVHLHRKLKELTNQSTRDFIRNIRLRQAAILLSEKNLTVSEVADATGFTNLGYFSNAFKELYGVSPSLYMNEQNKKTDH
ncbi:two-component regulator propeller domain-containing protein [Massilibacteroides sp.]|uniref:hybrid sensor histidine kinase/response regulator transcription factor n=1 Tax=Massilibacteroides sp. TaxID=2034766 RepID=UPI0026056DED|nr:two-component regulator propeller domain-containing protein [Massilibacteroides sp.]MDD4515947.1 two-component regulator propeller domain-containing protein [Massilibacteroides sp.]